MPPKAIADFESPKLTVCSNGSRLTLPTCPVIVEATAARKINFIPTSDVGMEMPFAPSDVSACIETQAEYRSMSRSIDGLFTERHEAQRLGISLRTLRGWRAKGYGPVPTFVGRFVFYRPEHEREFLDAGAQPFPKGRATRKGS